MIKIRSNIQIETKLLIAFLYMIAFLFVVIFFYYEGDKWSLADTHVIIVFASIPSLILTLTTMSLGRIGFLAISDASIYIKDDISLKGTWFFEIPFNMIDNLQFQADTLIFRLCNKDEIKVMLKYLIFKNENGEKMSKTEVMTLIQSRVSDSGNQSSYIRRISHGTLEKMLNERKFYNNIFVRVSLILSLLAGLYFFLNKF